MTPLAHYLTNQLTLPLAKRDEIARTYASFLPVALSGIHCFDVSRIYPDLTNALHDALLRTEAHENGAAKTTVEPLVFLPAPSTWIELNGFAFLLADSAAGIIRVLLFNKREIRVVGEILATDFRYSISNDWGGLIFKSDHDILRELVFLLAIINSPDVIDRRTRSAHKGLCRDVRKTKELAGFRFSGWTEIVLRVSKPQDIDDGAPHEHWLTGRRALHFCRKHIRIKNSRLEYVRAHWRGNAAFGIKRSRYRVEP